MPCSIAPFVCQYCHNLRHYNKLNLPSRPDTLKLLQRHLRQHPNTIAVLVVDAADLPASLVSHDIPSELAGLKGIVVALNKVDLFTGIKNQEQSVQKLRKWVQKRIERDVGGLLDPSELDPDNIVPNELIKVVPVSARTGDGIMDLLDGINAFRKDASTNVCFIGRPNAGKSQLINAITQLANGKQPERTVTASIYPGTTVGVVSHPLSEFGILFPQPKTPPAEATASQTPPPRLGEGTLQDTPGLFSTTISQLTTLLTPQELVLTIPSKPFRPNPKPVKLAPGRSLFIGGLVRIDCISGPETITAHIYASNLLPIHPCRTYRIEVLWSKLEKHTDILFPPIGRKRVDQLGGQMELAQRIVVGETRWKQKGVLDVAVGGVGWCRLEGVDGDTVVEVWSIAGGKGVSVRDSFFI
ncbi:hypothetical protein HDU98_008642 [Podochytrium sp. JEL0797]|nr:hypothetical protein HDU98_008642 [Podochytrium sp. JEL0797]